MRFVATLFAAALPIAFTTAQTPPTGFVIDTVISTGLNAPMDFCFLPDGRVLVANRAGVVSLWNGSTLVTVGTVPNVESGGERGLLSIASDPSFPTNGYIYVYYSSMSDAFMHLDRFTCTGDLANGSSTNLAFAAASRRVILAAIPDNAFNHNGGACRFGPDGMLYQTIGDDAGSCNAQSTTSSLGCLLRMNVAALPAGGDTTPPSFATIDPGTNPLSANADISQLVIANGLRNPFKMEIDQLTGNIYIGDVGQSSREEYSEYEYPPSGPIPLRNFGWPWREGKINGGGCGGPIPSGLTEPLVDFAGSWNSFMGGARYRNQGGPFDFGASFEGDAFCLDFFAGTLERLDHTGTAWPAATTTWGASGYAGVASLRQGPDGGLWFAFNTSTSPTSGGSIKRIRPIGPTNSVTAISGGGQVGPAGELFPVPLVARVFDTQNNPLPGGTVNFAITGAGTLTTVNPVIADANGYAQATVLAGTAAGGPITVTASTPNSQTNGVFSLYNRKITATPSGSLLILTITNQTAAIPAQVPYIVMCSFPRTPALPTFLGPIATNPLEPTTLVLEDAFGHFPLVSWAGTGGIGTPGMTKIYNPYPVAQMAGLKMTFQAVGLDPLTGWFRTNADIKQFP